MAETATVEIINKFVTMIEVSDTDENGERLLQLSCNLQDDSNFREELRKPIDKFDWLAFNKISRQVFFPESERFNHCMLFFICVWHKCLNCLMERLWNEGCIFIHFSKFNITSYLADTSVSEMFFSDNTDFWIHPTANGKFCGVPRIVSSHVTYLT